MGELSVKDLLRALRDKLLEFHERLVVEYTDPLMEFPGSLSEMSSRINFLYFTAGWCAPCTSFMEVIRAIARRYSGRAGFYKVDVDKYMDVVDVLRIDYIPAFIAVVDGEVVDRVYGVTGYNRVESMVRRVLESYG